MVKPKLPSHRRSKNSAMLEKKVMTSSRSTRLNRQKTHDHSDVLISAVISSYLLTHLHHVLQRAEYGATKEGRISQAANFAQLRKVLCMDARSMDDALALGMRDSDLDTLQDSNYETKVA